MRLVLVAIVVLSAAAVFAQGKGTVDDAWKAYLAADFETALGILEPLVARKDARAQALMAQMLRTGTGVSEDLEAALQLLREAAAKDCGEAYRMLAEMYQLGTGVERDYAQAVAHVRKAIDLGDAEAEVLLGFYYTNGHGVARNDDKGVALIRKGAERGNSLGQLLMGRLYLRGRGVTRDRVAAARWFAKAAAQRRADAWEALTRGVETKIPAFMYEMALLMHDGRGLSKPRPAVAKRLMMRAVGFGSDSAAEWALKHAAEGDPEAYMDASRSAYAERDKVMEGKRMPNAQDEIAILKLERAARRLAIVSAKMGNTKAMVHVSWLHQAPLNLLPTDAVEAYAWAKVAATLATGAEAEWARKTAENALSIMPASRKAAAERRVQEYVAKYGPTKR